jgi:hypothetical protein
MSKNDEPFYPEHLDEQIEALSTVPPEETSSSSSAHLVSHLRQVYQEDWAAALAQALPDRERAAGSQRHSLCQPV